MSIFTKLLGSDKIIDAAKNGIDAMFHTEEEKAHHFIKLLAAYEVFKVAQRFCMIIFCVPYALAWSVTFAMSCFNMDIANQLLLLSGNISLVVGVIVAFYFGGGAIEGIIKSK